MSKWNDEKVEDLSLDIAFLKVDYDNDDIETIKKKLDQKEISLEGVVSTEFVNKLLAFLGNEIGDEFDFHEIINLKTQE